MADPKYRLTMEEKMHLDGNSNSPDGHIIHSRKRVQRNGCSTSVLVFVVVLLSLACISLVIFLAIEKLQRNDEIRSSFCRTVLGTSNSSGNVTPPCTSVQCILASANILRTVDQNVDPCEDFFLHACGGWIKSNPIPPNEPLWNQVLALKKRNDQLLKRLLDDKTVRKRYIGNDAVQKAFLYYDSCTDQDAIEHAKGSPLLELIARYGSWNITNKTWTSNSWNFAETLVRIHKELKLSPLFTLQVKPDLVESSRYVIMIDQTTHTITRDAYLANTSYHHQVRKAYQQLMSELINLIGGETKWAEHQLKEVFEFEQDLSKLSATANERADRSKVYKLMTLKELQNKTGEPIDWLFYIKAMFQDTSYEIEQDEELAIFALDYLTNMSSLITNTPERVLANYMMWQVVVQLAPHLSEEYRRAFYNYHRVVMGSSGETDIWKKCITEMSRLDNDIGDPLGVIFLDEKFDKKDKESVMAMIDDLRETFIANLDKLDWMDNKTRAYAREKASAIRHNIGYPEYMKDKRKLSERFKDLTMDNSSYFNNVISIRAFSMKTMLKDLRNAVDKERWMIHPHTVNAFYDRVTNKIIFPAGILQIPFYNRKFPRAISYGGIGIVVAHEITHGFDSNGRKYNKNGDLVNWWSESSNEAFEKKSQCFIRQYSNFEAYAKKLNGIQTLGENIADNGAIKQAFMAYKKWIEKNGEEPQLPALNYTNEQLFFVDCGSILRPVALKKIEQATHTLDHWRVVGEMSNSKDFAAAFNCPAQSRMNPVKKCSIW
ncbi:endothelin-converting enzyme homolog isoform X2 [Pocillopora verrucosa]|uniref:endothelin-converting enzyme homolog isoform X2 n=1 Tax=Pocillopora verrucosa TaxID=203993 RepID=UPI002797150D|nr:endothelin-converting enzyme homolog isoform X2 [Pocillopora verrucosa]